MKVLVSLAICFTFNSAFAFEVPVFLEIARNVNGKVKYMSQEEAAQYCASQGARLPSARELTQLSVSLGAKGIVDSCGSEWSCAKRKHIQNADGTNDEFYFNYSGYQPPAGDLGNNWFWSSSVDSRYPEFGFFFNGVDGGIFMNLWVNRRHAVRCVLNVGEVN
jgi:hypothetical protein